MARSKSRRQSSASKSAAAKPTTVEANRPAPAEPLPPPTGLQKLALGVTALLFMGWIGFLAALAVRK